MAASPSRRSLLASLAVSPLAVRSARAEAKRLRLVAFGDSLTAGYGLARADGFAKRLETTLRAEGIDVEVVDAGVSGDTTDMGLARLEWSVPTDAAAVIVEFGANDMLRGLPPAEARANLDEIVGRLTARGQKVLIAGMVAGRNMGAAYAREFDPIFAEVARKHGALLYPFFLDGVALDPKMVLPDGLHPNAEGVKRIVAGILPEVRRLVAAARDGRT
ncbi:MAG: arylesterase [Siculibacillus sp.]